MTFRELLESLTDGQLDCDLAIYDEVNDEYYSAEALITDGDEDRLDPDHPYLKIKV